MRPLRILTCVAAAALLASPATAAEPTAVPTVGAGMQADSGDDTGFELGAFAGAVLPTVNLGASDGTDQHVDAALGLRAGYWFSRFIGVEAEALVMPRQNARSHDATGLGARAQLALQHPDAIAVGRLTPFLVAGAGIAPSLGDEAADTMAFAGHWGLGAHLELNNLVGLRMDARHVVTSGAVATVDHHVEALVGLSIGFGGDRDNPRFNDLDGDLIANRYDVCPEAAASTPNGCPVEGDYDGDGVANAADTCPAVYGTSAVGCPQRDADGDRIADVADACPQQPEDRDGRDDADGCPDLDDDGDGILDVADACPLEPGVASAAGCAPAGGSAEALAGSGRVSVRGGRLELSDRVRFKSGKASLLSGSKSLLDDVAQTLLAHPELGAIRIEGHTDSKGRKAKNRRLSARRAATVARYLRAHGVGADRLSTVGFGEAQPVASNATSDGRRANRRVEFWVADGRAARTSGRDSSSVATR